jgi:putative Mn2+ efflux pump MntP
MDICKTVSLKWWQAGIFKLGMWAIGIAVGAYFHTFFAPYYPTLIAIAVICLGYTTVVWLKQ